MRLSSLGPLVFALALVGAGCVTTGPTNPVLSSGERLEPDALWERIEERRAAVPAIRGTAKLRLEFDERAGAEPASRLSTLQAVLARTPAAFRLESLSPFGVSYVVATDGDVLSVLVPTEGYVYRGRAEEETIGSATGVRTSAAEICDALRGVPPLPAIDRSGTVVQRPSSAPSSPDGRNPEILLYAPVEGSRDLRVRYGFAHAAGGLQVVLYERLHRDGSALLRLRFTDFRITGDVPLASRVVVEAGDTRAEVTYREIDVATSLPDETFELATPPGMRDVALPR